MSGTAKGFPRNLPWFPFKDIYIYWMRTKSTWEAKVPFGHPTVVWKHFPMLTRLWYIIAIWLMRYTILIDQNMHDKVNLLDFLKIKYLHVNGWLLRDVWSSWYLTSWCMAKSYNPRIGSAEWWSMSAPTRCSTSSHIICASHLERLIYIRSC